VKGIELGNRAWLVALVLLLACGGPVGPIPGGALSGDVKPAPADWSFVERIEQVQLETNPADSHSVNTWIGTSGGALYLPTSMIRGPRLPTEREWVRNVETDDRVRLRVGDDIYELRAERVVDDAEAASARAALVKKYALGADDMDPEREIWIFRLVPR
jgi:F420H(2)-dependent quinone reductase